jgi:muramoyltetrapeptide carboxypeptidase
MSGFMGFRVMLPQRAPDAIQIIGPFKSSPLAFVRGKIQRAGRQESTPRILPPDMIFPPYLKRGDKVALISPSGKTTRAVIGRAADLLARQGFKVKTGRHALDDDGVFAGSDTARAADMQKALDNPSIRAVFFSRGGYGCLRTHQLLDWTAFHQHPKWLVGFSDNTVFHSYLSRQRTASIHGVMAASFEHSGAPSGSFLKLMDMLAGGAAVHDLNPHPLNRTGTAKGILTGGNLSILQSLRGTGLDLKPKGKILFIEDIHELNYRVDRMMQNLKAGGVLEEIRGLIVGHFTGMKDGAAHYGKTALEIIRDAVDPYDYPVVFGFPAGHELPNHPLLMGGRTSLEVSNIRAIVRNPQR